MAPGVKELTKPQTQTPAETRAGELVEQEPDRDGQPSTPVLVAQEPQPPDWQQIKAGFDVLMAAQHGRIQYAGWELNKDDAGDIHVVVYTGRAPGGK